MLTILTIHKSKSHNSEPTKTKSSIGGHNQELKKLYSLEDKLQREKPGRILETEMCFSPNFTGVVVVCPKFRL